jgi:hypothetical protein
LRVRFEKASSRAGGCGGLRGNSNENFVKIIQLISY